MSEDRYMFHMEFSPGAHGEVGLWKPARLQMEIAEALINAAIYGADPSVVLIAKRPDGRVIMFRRAWDAADEVISELDDAA